MTTTLWLDSTEMRLWRAFLTSATGVPASLDVQLKAATGISMDDYDVLVQISESPERRIRMSDLSKALLHSKSRITQRIDRLTERGWVTRDKVAEDARGTWAVLTNEGFAALTEAAPQHLEHVRSTFIDHLEPHEIEVMMTALERIANNARTQ